MRKKLSIIIVFFFSLLAATFPSVVICEAEIFAPQTTTTLENIELKTRIASAENQNLGQNLDNETLESNKSAQTQSQKRLWNLQNADIRSVIAAISKESGKNFIISPKVTGKVTIVSSKPIDGDEAYQVFLSALELLGYAVVPKGVLFEIIPTNQIRQGAPIVGGSDTAELGGEMIVNVVHLNSISATQIAPILQPLLPNYGQVTAYAPANTLIISGNVRSIDRLKAIIKQIDQASQNDIDVVHLRYSSANRIAGLVQSLQQANQKLGEEIRVSLIADDQHNNILMTGTQDARLKMRVLISELDVPSRGGSATKTYHLNHLKAKDFAPILTKIAQSAYLNMFLDASGAQSSKDKINIEGMEDINTVIVSAPTSMMADIDRIIKKLDVASRQVLVEAIIAEVKEGFIREIGTKWSSGSVSDKSGDAFSANFEVKPLKFGNNLIKPITFSGNIQALLTNSSSDVLSTPSTLVLDNQKAVISIGTNIALKSQTVNPTAGTEPIDILSRTNVALKLEVTPKISPNNWIQLKINLQNDSVAGTGNETPIDTSSIDTEVKVKSGEIVILGGLKRHDVAKGNDRLPILGEIPILNLFFKKRSKTENKKELVVFLRPIILEDNTREVVKKEYNYIREKQLRHHRGEKLIKPNEIPLLPARGQPAVHIPAPF